ncbi:MAG: hypothetical protein ACOZBL_05205 [Patescibacteria group bacterium]
MIKLEVPLIVAVNKTDLMDQRVFEKQFQQITKFFDFARRIPIIPISAKS